MPRVTYFSKPLLLRVCLTVFSPYASNIFWLSDRKIIKGENAQPKKLEKPFSIIYTTMVWLAPIALLFSWVAASSATVAPRTDAVTIQNTDPNIFYHGRWDSTFETWWYVDSNQAEVNYVEL